MRAMARIYVVGALILGFSLQNFLRFVFLWLRGLLKSRYNDSAVIARERFYACARVQMRFTFYIIKYGCFVKVYYGPRSFCDDYYTMKGIKCNINVV